jgi:hypothetical protein
MSNGSQAPLLTAALAAFGCLLLDLLLLLLLLQMSSSTLQSRQASRVMHWQPLLWHSRRPQR